MHFQETLRNCAMIYHSGMGKDMTLKISNTNKISMFDIPRYKDSCPIFCFVHFKFLTASYSRRSYKHESCSAAACDFNQKFAKIQGKLKLGQTVLPVLTCFTVLAVLNYIFIKEGVFCLDLFQCISAIVVFFCFCTRSKISQRCSFFEFTN